MFNYMVGLNDAESFFVAYSNYIKLFKRTSNGANGKE